MYRILIEYSGRDHRIWPSSHYGDVIDSIEIDSVDGPSLGGSYQVNLATKPQLQTLNLLVWRTDSKHTALLLPSQTINLSLFFGPFWDLR